MSSHGSFLVRCFVLIKGFPDPPELRIAVLVTYGGMDEKKLLRRFWITFGLSNVLIYGLVIIGVSVFSSIRVYVSLRNSRVLIFLRLD